MEVVKAPWVCEAGETGNASLANWVLGRKPRVLGDRWFDQENNDDFFRLFLKKDGKFQARNSSNGRPKDVKVHVLFVGGAVGGGSCVSPFVGVCFLSVMCVCVCVCIGCVEGDEQF